MFTVCSDGNFLVRAATTTTTVFRRTAPSRLYLSKSRVQRGHSSLPLAAKQKGTPRAGQSFVHRPLLLLSTSTATVYTSPTPSTPYAAPTAASATEWARSHENKFCIHLLTLYAFSFFTVACPPRTLTRRHERFRLLSGKAVVGVSRSKAAPETPDDAQ